MGVSLTFGNRHKNTTKRRENHNTTTSTQSQSAAINIQETLNLSLHLLLDMTIHHGGSTANAEWDIVPKKCEQKSDDLLNTMRQPKAWLNNYRTILMERSNPEKHLHEKVLQRRVQESEPARSDAEQRNKRRLTDHNNDSNGPSNGGKYSLGKFDSFMYYSLPDIRKELMSNPSSDKIVRRRCSDIVSRMGLRRPTNGVPPSRGLTVTTESPSIVRRRSRLSFEGHPLLIHENIFDDWSDEDTDSEEE